MMVSAAIFALFSSSTYVAPRIESRSGSIIEIPRIQGLPAPHPYALSADGTTVIGHFAPGNPFVYKNGTTSRFRPKEGVLDPYAQAVTADGQTVVGRAGEAYVWNRNKGLTPLGKPKNAPWPKIEDTFAYGVSANGKTITGYAQAQDGVYTFVYKDGKGMTLLTPPDETQNCFPNAISGDGSTIAGFGYLQGQIRPYVYKDQTWTWLPKMENFEDANPAALNNTGRTIVGYVSAPKKTRAAIWEQAAPEAPYTLKLLPSPATGNIEATCISPDGIAIGGIHNESAVLWLGPTREFLTLKEVLSRSGVSTEGWSLEAIKGITTIGNRVKLTGWGHHNKKEAGFVVTFSRG